MFTMMNTEGKEVQKAQKENLRETWDSKIEEHCVKPHTRDQSKRVWANRTFNWSNELSLSSKIRLFFSFHTSHIKQAGTMFQISKPNLPSQFLQLNSTETTFPSITHWIPNIRIFIFINASAQLCWCLFF